MRGVYLSPIVTRGRKINFGAILEGKKENKIINKENEENTEEVGLRQKAKGSKERRNLPNS